jgi:hypothetical protein
MVGWTGLGATQVSGSNLKLTREVSSDGLTALFDEVMLNSLGAAQVLVVGCNPLL